MIELGLQRISRLLAETPMPWRAIHVCGTNGKGSICAYVSAMLDVYNQSRYRQRLSQAALVHGRYTSPHLIDKWDGISVSGRTVDRSVFEAVEEAVESRNARGRIAATEFEVVTATAFNIFTQSNLDVAVVEVGMGGRLDATNVIGQPTDARAVPGRSSGSIESAHRQPNPPSRPPPLVTAISKIGMDHQAYLGNTLAKIAKEKAGIIKLGVPVVYDLSNELSVRQVIETVANNSGSRIVEWADFDLLDISRLAGVLPADELHDRQHSPLSTPSPIMSPHLFHEQCNISVALRSTLTALQELGRLPTASRETDVHFWDLLQNMAEAPSLTHVPGRQQWNNLSKLTGDTTPVLIDGAHNGQSATALADHVKRLRVNPQDPDSAPQPMVWVLAASDSKDVAEILQPLLVHGDSVFAVEFGPVDGMPWVKPRAASHILEASARLVPGSEKSGHIYDCGTDLVAALTAASRACRNGAGRHVVVAGSLYLVGDVYRLLRDS